MPFGNGDVSAQAWVERSTGDLLMYLAKSDAFVRATCPSTASFIVNSRILLEVSWHANDFQQYALETNHHMLTRARVCVHFWTKIGTKDINAMPIKVYYYQPTYLPTNLPTYLPTYLPACLPACLPTEYLLQCSCICNSFLSSQ